MKKLGILLVLAFASSSVSGAAPDYKVPPQFPVQRPMIVAFFPVTAAELKDVYTNEALSDFQFYVSRVDKPLHKVGVTLHRVYAQSFKIQILTGIQVFQPEEGNCGYYFIAPGKKPKVEYGVMTDADLYQEAAAYFGISRQRFPQ
jgi:hypothetical protein